MISQTLYRVQIVEYPEFEEYYAWDKRHVEHSGIPWERPVGWEPTPDYTERFQTDKFFEPSTDKWYKSRSSAAERAKLLNSMGYVAIVQKSAPVVWPADGEKSVSQNVDVAKALRIVRAHGFHVAA